MPKTRRLGILRQILVEELKTMEPGTKFETKDIIENLEKKFDAPVNPRTIGALLGQYARTTDLVSGERLCGDPATWTRGNVI